MWRGLPLRANIPASARSRGLATLSRMGIFSMPPRSFEINRKSDLASDLKSAISTQLQHSLGSLFSDDDTFAEYVTVLVCNGKTQNQARADLDEFLGERSGDFVSWLWDFLSKHEQNCKVGGTSKHEDQALLLSGDIESTKIVAGLKNKETGDIDNLIQKNPNVALPDEVTSSPEGTLLSGAASSSSPSGNACSRFTCQDSEYAEDRPLSGTSKACIPPVIIGSLYCDKVNRSVWDRLGQPGKARDTVGHADDAKKWRKGSPDRWSQSQQNSYACQIISKKAVHQWKENLRHKFNWFHGIHSLDNNLLGASMTASNIWKKRKFVPSTGRIASLVGERCMDDSHKIQTLGNKKAHVASAPKDVLSTVQDVKLRLQQIEKELSMLRSKTGWMGVNRRNCSLTMSGNFSSGLKKSSVGDFESKTLLVANVHYAANREALSMHFARCGRVDNVVLLSNTLSFGPESKSAHVTFLSRESADKALGLNGTTFFSRTLKVFKCGSKDAISTPTASNTSSHHLHWRRDSTSSAVSAESASVNTTEKAGLEDHRLSLNTPLTEIAGHPNALDDDDQMPAAEKTEDAASDRKGDDLQSPLSVTHVAEWSNVVLIAPISEEAKEADNASSGSVKVGDGSSLDVAQPRLHLID